MAVGYGAGRYSSGLYGQPLSLVSADAAVKAVSGANVVSSGILAFRAAVRAAVDIKVRATIEGSFGAITIPAVSNAKASGFRVIFPGLGPIAARGLVVTSPTTVVSVTALVAAQSDLALDPVISVAAAALVRARADVRASGRGNYENEVIPSVSDWALTTPLCEDYLDAKPAPSVWVVKKPATDTWSVITDASSVWKETALA
jgi:hypothetical protein